MVLASQMIADLQRLIATYGDKPVEFTDPETRDRVACTVMPAIGERRQGTYFALVPAERPVAVRRD